MTRLPMSSENGAVCISSAYLVMKGFPLTFVRVHQDYFTPLGNRNSLSAQDERAGGATLLDMVSPNQLTSQSQHEMFL